MMQHQVQSRLDELRNEMSLGRQRVQDLERQLASVRDAMLRISGAIQVLEELFQTDGGSADFAAAVALAPRETDGLPASPHPDGDSALGQPANGVAVLNR
jgi:hypothetical protein